MAITRKDSCGVLLLRSANDPYEGDRPIGAKRYRDETVSSNHLKRLLLFTYHYPPKPVAGSLRPAYLCKYLANHGWATTVITPAENTVDRSTAQSVSFRQRLAATAPHFAKRAFHNVVCFPDDAIFWVPRALRDASRALREQMFDAVMSTAMPASMHIAGYYVSRKYSLPWLTDYRDLWTANPYRTIGPSRIAIEKRLERFLLRQTSAITTVSNSFVDSLKELAPSRPVYVIPNAFDPEDWLSVANQHPKEFRLCFGGQLYDGRRSPEVLFAALASLRDQSDPAGLNATVDFYGEDLRMIPAIATRFGLSTTVKLHGVVTRSEMLRAQRDSAVLLILLRPDKAASGEYGSKIFEYMGAKRPMLAIGGADSVIKPLIETNGLGFFVSDVDQCKNALRKLYDNFSRGEIEPRVNPLFQPFTAPQLASRFAEVLDVMVSKTNTPGAT